MPSHIFIKLLIVSLSIHSFGFAQGIEKSKAEHVPKIRGAIMMANSHIPKAIEGTFKGITVPTWGFDLDYYFRPKWSVALQGDVKLQSYEIEDENILLKRTNPIALLPVIHAHVFSHWSFYTGIGYELEKHKNFLLWRIGTEYSFEITEKFEIALNLIYDNKEEVYDTWTFGIAFNKRLWKKE